MGKHRSWLEGVTALGLNHSYCFFFMWLTETGCRLECSPSISGRSETKPEAQIYLNLKLGMWMPSMLKCILDRA